MANAEMIPSELGARITVERHALILIDGVLSTTINGRTIRIGCTTGLPTAGRQLVVTSRKIQIRQGRIFTECSCCEGMQALEEIGLRRMPNGDLRNQPQCSSCRGLSVEDRDVLKRRTRLGRPPLRPVVIAAPDTNVARPRPAGVVVRRRKGEHRQLERRAKPIAVAAYVRKRPNSG